MKKRFLLLILVMCGISGVYAKDFSSDDVLTRLNRYNVIWNTLGTSGSMESMPLGNGDVTVNAWVEKDGDLMLYIGKSDTWSEATRLLKIGRVRIHFSPNPFTEDAGFAQVLNLGNGEIDITSGTSDMKFRIKLWVDANRPVIRIDAGSNRNFSISCTTELMRRHPYTLTPDDNPLADSFRGVVGSPLPITESADILLRREGGIEWVHRNETSPYRMIMTRQNVPELADKYPDPYLYRTFGAAAVGSDMVPANDSTLVSIRESKKIRLSIYPYTAQCDNLDEWRVQMDRIISQADGVVAKDAYQKHLRWWSEFWNRSWIFLSGDQDAETVTRAYILQRYMMACQSRGEYPVKFNGGTLTFDYAGQDGDYRRWGSGYWFQNCRLLYCPLMVSGDFDLVKPWFDMYMKMLPLQMDVTRSYYGHSGAFFPETLNFFGMYIQDDWGWHNQGKASQTRWIRYHYSGALEMLAQMIDYYSYKGEADFARNYIIPFATQVIRFFSQHWTQVDQTIRFIPANSLEQFWDCLNPTDYIAGLKYTLAKLDGLPSALVSEELKKEWRDCAMSLPDIPIREGKILPAEEYGAARNFENPECYAIFPFRLYGLGYPDMDIALNTYQNRIYKHTTCWSQCPIQAALLGLADEAKGYIIKNATSLDPDVRFPAFWKPGSDYIPDFDNGGVMAAALQYMLLNNVGREIRVLPALPESWDVDFKLNAYDNTTVRLKTEKGKVRALSVYPVEREADIKYR